MMRYQRVSPDCLGLSNGRKPSIRPSSSSCKDDAGPADEPAAGRISSYTPFEAKPLRVRSASGSQTQDSHSHHFPHFSAPLSPEHSKPPNNNHHDGGNGKYPGGDVLLQWGHNKRSRGSRAENRAAGDDSSAQSRQQHVKVQRRAAIAGAERIAAAAAMPPPCGGGYVRGANLRASMPLRDSTASHHNRTFEERSTGHHSRSSEKQPPTTAAHHKMAAAATTTTTTASNRFGPDPSSSMNHHHNNNHHHYHHDHELKNPSDQDTVGSGSGGAAAEKVSLEQFEWPRIYLSLSRKEKEDDFLAMKGTKLPQRPKKRAKNIDKTLQYCFPGMWLSDLTRGRYEVREKKCVKKKRRGLKGMESMDSESE